MQQSATQLIPTQDLIDTGSSAVDWGNSVGVTVFGAFIAVFLISYIFSRN